MRMIQNMRRRNPKLGMVELWHRLRKRGYTRRPYTPRHNGKVEHSHREEQKRFDSAHCFFSLNDFATQLAVHNRRSNNFRMRPLNWRSPSEFAVQYL